MKCKFFQTSSQKAETIKNGLKTMIQLYSVYKGQIVDSKT